MDDIFGPITKFARQQVDLHARIKKLEAENQRLRKGLERVISMCVYEGEVIQKHGIPAIHRSACRALLEDE